jgi:uncharacterized protein YacL
MAAPNIVNVATITAKTALVRLADTSENTLVSNSASSGKVFKINNIIVSNVDGTDDATITVVVWDTATVGSTNGTKIAHTINVPADSTLVLIDKSSAIYLEEDRSIGVTASAADDLHVICSYEEIS